MKRRRRRPTDRLTFYSEITEQGLPITTTPMPRVALPRESWIRKTARGMGAFFSAIINKVNQLLALALAVLLLLLFTRFILNFFHLTSGGDALRSSFSYWVFFLSTPLIAPFENLLPTLPYNGYTIDVSTLIAIVAYALGITIIRQFLKVLVAH
jgi:uncharacterized protein YggT (Ycf19 family)